jgi:Transcription elongation factor, N-terminal
MNKLPMTAAGHSVLEEELKRRIQVERPRLIQRIQEAIADDSNLAENSEYQAAETEREINENRIAARIQASFFGCKAVRDKYSLVEQIAAAPSLGHCPLEKRASPPSR